MRRHRKEHTSGGQDKGDNCGSSLLRKRKRSENNYRGNSMCKGQGGVSPSLEEAKEGRRKKLQEMWLEKGGVGAQAGSLLRVPHPSMSWVFIVTAMEPGKTTNNDATLFLIYFIIIL